MFTKSPLFPSLDEVVNFFHKNWDEKKEKVEWQEHEEGIFQKEGIEIIRRFYNSNQPWNFHAVDLESRFEVLLEDAPRKEYHVLAGIIDRIDKLDDGTYEIIDYKTARRMPSQDALNRDLQLSIYHLGLLKRWPHLASQNIKLTLQFLKHNEKISTFRSPDALEKTKESLIKDIREIQERVKNNDFPATPSALCDWCGYRKICPVWKHLYAAEEPTPDNQQMQEIIKEYFFLKEHNQNNNRKIAELQKMILGFMENEKMDRVFGNDGYITKTIRTAVLYDLEKTKTILLPLGKWEETLKVDERKLEKIIAVLPAEIQEKFKELVIEKKASLTLTATRKKIEIKN